MLKKQDLEFNQRFMTVYLNQQSLDSLFYLNLKYLIKIITKFSNMTGYHQPHLSTNKTVYMSCL